MFFFDGVHIADSWHGDFVGHGVERGTKTTGMSNGNYRLPNGVCAGRVGGRQLALVE